jgi:hypothetical protein
MSRWAASFLWFAIPVDALQVTEGSLVIAKRENVASLMPRLTPDAEIALTRFLEGSA